MTITLDTTYVDILYYLKMGQTNSYQIWATMSKESNGKCLAYKNVHQRMHNLLAEGWVKHIKVTGINLHARKDYVITKKAQEDLRKYALRLLEIVD